jgi:hypothetical protein
MNTKSIKRAAPMFSYYGTQEGSNPGFALPAGRGRLDHEDSDMIHGYNRVKKAKETGVVSTDFHYSVMPSVAPCHVYLEYLDGHFPSSATLQDLLPRLQKFLETNLKH